MGHEEGGLGGEDRAVEEGDHGLRECEGEPFFADFRGGRGEGGVREDPDTEDQAFSV